MLVNKSSIKKYGVVDLGDKWEYIVHLYLMESFTYILFGRLRNPNIKREALLKAFNKKFNTKLRSLYLDNPKSKEIIYKLKSQSGENTKFYISKLENKWKYHMNSTMREEVFRAYDLVKNSEDGLKSIINMHMVIDDECPCLGSLIKPIVVDVKETSTVFHDNEEWVHLMESGEKIVKCRQEKSEFFRDMDLVDIDNHILRNAVGYALEKGGRSLLILGNLEPIKFDENIEKMLVDRKVTVYTGGEIK